MGGRPKGTVNKDVARMRAAWVAAFDAMQQGSNSLIRWGEQNPTEFYRLARQLIPQQVESSVDITSGGESIRQLLVRGPNAFEAAEEATVEILENKEDQNDTRDAEVGDGPGPAEEEGD